MAAPTPLPRHPATAATAALLDRVVDGAVGPLPVDRAAQLAWVHDGICLERAAEAGFDVGLSRAMTTAFAGRGGAVALARAVGMTRWPVRRRMDNASATSARSRAMTPTDAARADLARSLREIGGLIGGRPGDRDRVAHALSDCLHAITCCDAAWELMLVRALAGQVSWRLAESELGFSHSGLTYRLSDRPGRDRLVELVDRHPGGAAARLLAACWSRQRRPAS